MQTKTAKFGTMRLYFFFFIAILIVTLQPYSGKRSILMFSSMQKNVWIDFITENILIGKQLEFKETKRIAFGFEKKNWENELWTLLESLRINELETTLNVLTEHRASAKKSFKCFVNYSNRRWRDVSMPKISHWSSTDKQNYK